MSQAKSSVPPMISLRRHVGQLLIIGFDGTEMSPRLRFPARRASSPRASSCSRATSPARANSYACSRTARSTSRLRSSPASTSKAARSIASATSSARRLRAADVFATGDRKLFRKHGRVIGENCRALGFNIDFAPALDLAFEASRTVMSSRAVSADPKAGRHLCSRISRAA